MSSQNDFHTIHPFDFGRATFIRFLLLYLLIFLYEREMAQTKEGALKVAAGKAGMSHLDFIARLTAGERRCTKCKQWQPIDQFCLDRSRNEGISKTCYECRRVKDKKPPHRISGMKGRRHSLQARANMAASRRGNNNRLGKRHTLEARRKISLAVRALGLRGQKCPAYIDGRSSERAEKRNSFEYKQWRTDVFFRDKFICQHCGYDKGGRLEAHHIKSYAKYPDLRFDVSNGITLCWNCHDAIHACRVGRTKARR